MRDVVQIPGYSDYAVDRFGAIYTRRPRGGRKSVPFGSAVGEWRVMGQDQTPRGYFRVSDQWDQLLCRLKGGESMTSLGKEYGLSRQAISRRVLLTSGTITYA